MLNRLSFHIDRSMFPVRLLRSIPFQGLLRYYGPVRLPTRVHRWLFLPTGSRGWGRTPSDLPGSSVNLSTRAVPFHPGEPGGCLRPFLLRQHWASPFLGGWPTLISLTRPNWVRLRYGSRFRRSEASHQTGLPRPAIGQLHVKRTITW